MKNFIIVFCLIIDFTTAHAQLSPGDLAQPHTHLEGIANCTQCHELGKKISSSRCLDCHKLLRERISQNEGLHSLEEYQNCENCHVEHQGRNFELIWWKNGKDNFDHSLTGYKLEGKHSQLKCNECHQPQNIQTIQRFKDLEKNINRTFLGLDKNCLHCHRDEHRDQIKKTCLDCHTMTGWEPASGFNHSNTDFPLTGKHSAVSCDKCHNRIIDNKYANDPDYLKFTGLAFDNCSNCHSDVHNNRFGSNCNKCHNTSGWQSYNRKYFSHDQTRFPLSGKHATLACEKCHPPGKPLKGLQFQKCSDCHPDHHRGQFADRDRQGACKECHTINGFSPALFTIDQHQQTDYPLRGAHLAIPCISCHKKTDSAEYAKTMNFTFSSTRCSDCHSDPHQGEVKKYIQAGGCEHCHSVMGWPLVTFDHSKTNFPLIGKHKKVACKKCHASKEELKEADGLKFSGLSTNCQNCHTDIHQAQFAVQVKGKEITQCNRCHTPDSWKAELFNHNRDAAFKLEGAHQKVSCGKCHRTITVDGVTYTKYKPIDSSCVTCHGKPPKQEEL